MYELKEYFLAPNVCQDVMFNWSPLTILTNISPRTLGTLLRESGQHKLVENILFSVSSSQASLIEPAAPRMTIETVS